MVVRLPRIARATGQVAKEQRWLPELAPQLPLAIPEPLAMGRPGEGYPWPWSVYRWLEGEVATDRPVADPRRGAVELGRFVSALRQPDADGGPAGGEHSSFRGLPLDRRDSPTRAAIAGLDDTVDAEAAAAAWEAALQAPQWSGPPAGSTATSCRGTCSSTGAAGARSSISDAWASVIRPAT
jgi:aminoglycoside phosphotransferase (APT) family kinase protein